ncbi:MAG: hypothetical protein ACTSPY_00720 [Candidatus Helarchaeota archaeon]
MTDVNNFIVFSIIFATILISIAIFILTKLIKAEKEAKPFLFSLFLYFFLMALVSYIQAGVFIVNPLLTYEYGVYNDYWGVILIYAAPIFLIYEIEQLYFKAKIFTKNHLITILVLVTFGLFIGISVYDIIFNPTFFYPFEMRKYWYTNYLSWLIIVLFICVSFLYLGTKASGKYRQYCFLISIGWSINQIINAITQLLTFETIISIYVLPIIFVVKFIGAILTMFGFYKLYSLSTYK